MPASCWAVLHWDHTVSASASRVASASRGASTSGAPALLGYAGVSTSELGYSLHTAEFRDPELAPSDQLKYC